MCLLTRIYILKLNNKITKARCEIYFKLTIKIPERHHWRRPGVFIINFEHISHLVPVFLLLTYAGWAKGFCGKKIISAIFFEAFLLVLRTRLSRVFKTILLSSYYENKQSLGGIQ